MKMIKKILLIALFFSMNVSYAHRIIEQNKVNVYVNALDAVIGSTKKNTELKGAIEYRINKEAEIGMAFGYFQHGKKKEININNFGLYIDYKIGRPEITPYHFIKEEYFFVRPYVGIVYIDRLQRKIETNDFSNSPMQSVFLKTSASKDNKLYEHKDDNTINRTVYEYSDNQYILGFGGTRTDTCNNSNQNDTRQNTQTYKATAENVPTYRRPYNQTNRTIVETILEKQGYRAEYGVYIGRKIFFSNGIDLQIGAGISNKVNPYSASRIKIGDSGLGIEAFVNLGYAIG